ncbi:hypothetical protein L0F63_002966 [Massospora cicadina]|nr:hypothetical protein L0F63_002966 [Massospora cicadina]
MREDPRLFSIQKDAQKNVDSYLSSGTDPSLASMEDVHGSAEHQEACGSVKIYDAQSMVLFISNSWRLQRNEWLLWVMNHMFRNVVPKEEKDSCFEVIELSTQPLQFWKESNASVDDCHTPKHEEDVNFWACNQASPPSQEEDLSTNLLPAFRIVPQTQIFTIYHSYAVVFLLDLSSSISTIDAYTHQLQVDQVMETFHKCVRGITPPFIVPSSYHREHFHFQPRLYISVLCDCTPFPASQLQDASASSIRVLLQNAVLTLENVEVTLAYVNQKVTELQSEMACTYASRLQQCPLPPESFETAPNRFLEAGALSLRLLPQDSSRCSCSSRMAEGVLLTVIQVGSSLGFTPACSFGYVPDNESLRFLAMATGGKFLYAADCPTFPGGPCPKATYPNFYHCMFLIQDACFQKDRPLNRHATVNVGQERMVDLPVHRLLNPQPESLASNWLQEATSGGFPWYVESHPPPTDLLLTRYRDYALPLETSCVLNARLREGFFIERILLSGSHQNRAEKIHVNLAMTWLPNVVIQYRIRAQLPSDFKASQPSRKYLRIEMNILAPTVFAVSFVNLDATAEPATSLLANVASLHAFLRSIFATDDTLKSLSTMLQQFPMLKAPRDRDPSNNTIAPALLQKLDVDAVKSLWSSFENSRLDYISNGLFDHHSAILTAVEPTLSSDFRLADLAEYLANLDYHSISETTYIKYLYAQKPGQLNFPSFCILRLQLLSGSLLWSRLVFINVRYSVRKALSQKHVATYACIKETFTVRCCRRPLHSLLVTQPLTHDLIRRTDQLIPSKYLLESRTHRWLSSNDHDPYFPAQGLPTIHHLAFSLLARAKLAQGFVRIGAQGHCQLFYKELACGKCFGMQYQLEMEDLRVLSRVWVEPITGDAFENQSQRSIDDVLRQDERVVSNLFAFDQIHYACRQKLNLFQASVRLGSLALNSVALVSTYKLPMLSANSAQDLLTAQRDLAILGRSSHFRPLADEASCSPLGHPLNYPLKLTLTEDEYFQLSPLIANLLLFQFFMESAVMLACDAAVTAQTDDSCPTFLPWVHPLGQAVPQVSSLRWGFAKKLSPVTFALVFVPKVEDLLQAYWDASSHTGDVASLPTMGLLTYECIREDLNCASPKTSTQAGENLHSFNQSAHASNRYLFIPAVPALHNVIATPERLELWAKGSKSCPTVALKVHALHASFDAIHARAFVQATYAAMLQGHAVPSQDIRAVLDLCQVLTLTVSLTDYLNLKVEKERRNLDQEDIRERAEQKLQRKFAALIGYHFGEVATEGWRGTYFFKTPQKPNIHLWDYENLGSSHSKDNLAQEEPRSLPHLLAQAAHPMFMTLNMLS